MAKVPAKRSDRQDDVSFLKTFTAGAPGSWMVRIDGEVAGWLTAGAAAVAARLTVIFEEHRRQQRGAPEAVLSSAASIPHHARAGYEPAEMPERKNCRHALRLNCLGAKRRSPFYRDSNATQNNPGVAGDHLKTHRPSCRCTPVCSKKFVVFLCALDPGVRPAR